MTELSCKGKSGRRALQKIGNYYTGEEKLSVWVTQRPLLTNKVSPSQISTLVLPPLRIGITMQWKKLLKSYLKIVLSRWELWALGSGLQHISNNSLHFIAASSLNCLMISAPPGLDWFTIDGEKLLKIAIFLSVFFTCNSCLMLWNVDSVLWHLKERVAIFIFSH